MDHRIDRLHHTSPVLKVLQEQGQRTPIEDSKKKIDKEFGQAHHQPAKGDSTKKSAEQLEKIIDEANAVIFGKDTHFQFEIHEKTGDVVIKLVNNETKEVVKEIPPEKLIEIMDSLWDLVGVLVDKRA